MYVQDYFHDTLFDAAAAVVEGAQAEGLTGHAAALCWTMYHSALRPEHSDAVVIGDSSAEQLSQDLDNAEAGPVSDALAQKFENVWKSVRDGAPKNHSSYFERERR